MATLEGNELWQAGGCLPSCQSSADRTRPRVLHPQSGVMKCRPTFVVWPPAESPWVAVAAIRRRRPLTSDVCRLMSRAFSAIV